MKVAPGMLEIAKRAFMVGTALRRTSEYSIFELPPGFMDHFVLVLWEAGRDFPPDRVPEAFEVPVRVEGRPGYLIERSRALAIDADPPHPSD